MSETLAAITDLILETFRLNGRLLAAGDELVGDLGLTSARWQVIGAVALAATALPVAHIARNMGLTRQGVQRIANELEADGLVKFAPNPHHARAKLVRLTAAGRRAFAAANARQGPWALDLAAGLSIKRLDTALGVLRQLHARLARHEPSRDDGRG